MTVDNGDLNGIKRLMDLAATMDRGALFAGLQMAMTRSGLLALGPPQQTNRYGRTGKR